jgi:putative transposase
VADFAYIWTADGWLYMAADLDLFCWRVVGRSVAFADPPKISADFVQDTLAMKSPGLSRTHTM